MNTTALTQISSSKGHVVHNHRNVVRVANPSCSSSSEESPPPFVSTVPKTLPSYVGSPQGSPTETPAIMLTRPSVSSNQSIPTICSLPSSLDDFVPSLPPTPPAHQRSSTPKHPSLEPLNPASKIGRASCRERV